MKQSHLHITLHKGELRGLSGLRQKLTATPNQTAHVKRDLKSNLHGLLFQALASLVSLD